MNPPKESTGRLTKALNALSAFGALILLGSWLFQTLYAESMASELRAISETRQALRSHDAAVFVLRGLEAVTVNATAKKEVQSLQLDNLASASAQYMRFQPFGLCTHKQLEPKWIQTPATIDERCARYLYWATQNEALLREWQSMSIEKLKKLSDPELRQAGDRLQLATALLVNEAIPIKEQLLAEQSARNRWIFIVLYIVGSLLTVGAQVVRVIWTPEK